MSILRTTAIRGYERREVLQPVTKAAAYLDDLCDKAFSMGKERIPFIKKAVDISSKKNEEMEKQSKVKKEYSHILGAKDGGMSGYYSAASSVLERVENSNIGNRLSTASDTVKAGFGIITVVNALDQMPSKVVRAIEVVGQEDTARKVNAVSEIVSSNVSATSAALKVSCSALNTVNRTKQIGLLSSTRLSVKNVVKDLGTASRVLSGVYFAALAIPRIYALKEIYTARKGYKKILNDESLTDVDKSIKIRKFLNKQLELTDDEKVSIYEKVEKNLIEEFKSIKPNARAARVNQYVESKIQGKLSHAVHEELTAKKEAFERVFGKKVLDLLTNLNRKRKISSEDAKEITSCINRSIIRQTFINLTALFAITLGLTATVLSQIYSGGVVSLISLVLSVSSTSIWLGFDIYQLIKDLKMKKLSNREIFFKFMSFAFFAASLIVTQVATSNIYSTAAITAGSVVWLFMGMYLKYRSNKKQQLINKVKHIDSRTLESFRKLRV
ncbi:MAG: hypothetical protein S4CHLAM37_06710 [Chlamydiia bacterium]|nr:hypothetical protein [Chlamydiia bacterium]